MGSRVNGDCLVNELGDLDFISRGAIYSLVQLGSFLVCIFNLTIAVHDNEYERS